MSFFSPLLFETQTFKSTKELLSYDITVVCKISVGFFMFFKKQILCSYFFISKIVKNLHPKLKGFSFTHINAWVHAQTHMLTDIAMCHIGTRKLFITWWYTVIVLSETRYATRTCYSFPVISVKRIITSITKSSLACVWNGVHACMPSGSL